MRNLRRSARFLTAFLCASAATVALAKSAEQRVVVFRDGPMPKLEVNGERWVRGPVDVELRFEGTNPFCYRYHTGFGAGAAAYGADAPLPALPQLRTASAAASPAEAGEASQAIASAGEALEKMIREARETASIDEVWDACDSGGNVAAQQTRLDSATRALTSGLATTGRWRQALIDANAAIESALSAARAGNTASITEAEIEARRTARADAVRRAEEAAERVNAARKAKQKVSDADSQAAEQTAAEAEKARLALAEAERQREASRGAQDLAERAERLSKRRDQALQQLGVQLAEVRRARALLVQAPSVLRKHLSGGMKAAIQVTRVPLANGRPNPAAGAQTFNAPAVHSLNPIFLDVGIGPALTIGRNSQDYDLVVQQGKLVNARTEQELIVDGMVSVSAYLWGQRYLDDTIFDPIQLLPRPMFGISLRDPFTSIYAGGQIDPVQFVNLAGGVRFSSAKAFVGQKFDQEHPDQPGDPATRERVVPLGFAAITFSTDLFWRWVKREVD